MSRVVQLLRCRAGEGTGTRSAGSGGSEGVGAGAGPPRSLGELARAMIEQVFKTTTVKVSLKWGPVWRGVRDGRGLDQGVGGDFFQRDIVLGRIHWEGGP